MQRVAVVLTVLASTLVASAQTVAEKKQRDAVDETVAKAADDIADCGKKFKLAFDWKGYDSIDWKKIGRDKTEYYANEQNSVADLGKGINTLCADKDYKAALAKISTIVFVSTNDESISLKAVVSRGTLTFRNYTFGSTRHTDDFVSAGKAAL